MKNQFTLTEKDFLSKEIELAGGGDFIEIQTKDGELYGDISLNDIQMLIAKLYLQYNDQDAKIVLNKLNK